MIGGHQMLATVFDPFDRPAEAERAEADQHVLRINLAAYAEAAADVALIQVHTRRLAAEHAGERVAVPVRHLGGAVQFENAAHAARDGAARLQRRTAVAADL